MQPSSCWEVRSYFDNNNSSLNANPSGTKRGGVDEKYCSFSLAWFAFSLGHLLHLMGMERVVAMEESTSCGVVCTAGLL